MLTYLNSLQLYCCGKYLKGGMINLLVKKVNRVPVLCSVSL